MEFDLDKYIQDLKAGLKFSLLEKEKDRFSIDFKTYSIKNRSFEDLSLIREKNTYKNIYKDLSFIVGPCSIRDEKSTYKIAKELEKEKIKFFRAGCFKPRTSPYSFQGLKKEGLKILSKIKRDFDFVIVSEIMDLSQLDDFCDVDILQVGSRNMQNFSLLEGLSRQEKTVLLKRGLASSLKEFLSSCEYLSMNGKKNIILCNRLLKSVESPNAFSFDFNSNFIIKKICKFPLIFDPSHGSLTHEEVPFLSLAALSSFVDGLMIEYTDDRKKALSDAFTSIDKKELSFILKSVSNL